MWFAIILQGMAAGFLIAAPVGPVGIMCVRRTLSDGRVAGIISGLGAALADSIYGGIVGFGVTWLFVMLENKETLLQFVGGAFLCFLGIRTYLAMPATATKEQVDVTNLLEAFTSTFFLTLTNPMTMLGFAGVFATLGIAHSGDDFWVAAVLTGSVFVGAALWWLGITSVVAMLRHRMDENHLRWLNRMTGILITSFGALALLYLMWSGQSLY